jgi:hypothetical protein
MDLWKKYIGIFAVLSFLAAGFPGAVFAVPVCGQAEAAAGTATDCHEVQKEADTKTEQNCCGAFCDGMGCGKMPLVTPAERTDFKAPSLSGYEIFDLTANGTRLERLMRPPISR